MNFNLTLTLAVCSLLLFTAAFAADYNGQKQPLVFIPQTVYRFSQIVDGNEIMHDFIIRNKGSAALIIEKVKTG
ncbi:MAG: hypothetical protein JRK26_25130 [Deltaproteobacteria bacterium]|nr:hypothetical protein [Deltaproteobacteria bacterium]